MAVSDLTPYQSYVQQVVARILSDNTLAQFPKCEFWLNIHVTDLSDWQIALPLISCLAAGGSLEDGIEIASAWYLMYLASDLLIILKTRNLFQMIWYTHERRQLI